MLAQLNSTLVESQLCLCFPQYQFFSENIEMTVLRSLEITNFVDQVSLPAKIIKD